MDWRIEKHYGFGAGRVTLRAEGFAQPVHSRSLHRELGDLLRELHRERSIPQQLASLGLFASLCAIMVATLAGVLAKPPPDRSDIRLVMLQTREIATPQPVLDPELPILPVPKPAAPKPEVAKLKPPEPVKVVVAKPEPPARVKPDQPAPPPKRARPKVKIDGLAAVPDVQPAAAVPRSRVASEQKRARQRVALEPVAKLDPANNARSQRSQRSQLLEPNPTDRRAKPIAPLAAADPISSQPLADAAPRAERFALAKSSPGRRRTRVQPAIPLDTSLPAAPSRSASIRRGTAKAQPRLRNARPPTAVEGMKSAPQPRAAGSERTQEKSLRRTTNHAPAKALRRAVTALALATPSVVHAAATAHPAAVQGSQRTEAIPSGDSDHSPRSNARLAGVPLATLAACMTDQAEDSLKRRLVAAVKVRSKCVGTAGTYHFIETKNLNAFSMMIERAPGHRAGDRCDELERALACVTR